MLGWLIAGAAGLALAALTYVGRPASRSPALIAASALARAIAATLLVALLLDAPLGRAAVAPPLVALDVSASWVRTGDSARFSRAAAGAARLSDDVLLLFGDSLRPSSGVSRAGDGASRVRPAVERALAAGRALVVVTDGALDDADELQRLPSGSRVQSLVDSSGADLAVLALDAPRAAVGGDTIDVAVRIAAGARGGAAGVLHLTVAGALLDSALIDAVPAYGEVLVQRRVALPRREGPMVLGAVVSSAGDVAIANDSVAAAIELSAAAGVTVVSTAPDYDLRYMLEVLRGTVALPTRAYLEVAPGVWRTEGSYAPVEESVVRETLRRSPIGVLHGDTSRFGIAGGVGQGALLLAPAAASGDPEWYAVAAPPSPLAAALSGAPWDSLAPLAVGVDEPRGEWVGLTVQRGRRFERRVAVAGREEPRRRVVVGVAGLWRWRFRGGAGADAYSALWGGIFDWLAAERRDARAAVPDAASLRAGEPVRWRRGGIDSVVAAVLRRRGDADSTLLELHFAAGAATTTSPPLREGLYDVRTEGGSSILAVNASRELLPQRPTASDGAVGRAPAPTGVAPMMRGAGGWPYVLIVLLFCAEWLLRRRAGLR